MKIAQVLFNQPAQSFSDISGQGLTITKTGTFKSTPPLTSRTNNSVFIESTNSLTLNSIPIAVRTHEEESFSISFYLKAGDSFTTPANIFYDNSNGIGFKLSEANLSFTVSSSTDSYVVGYKLPSISKKILVQAVYSKRVISLIVDGVAQDQIELPKTYKFKATSPISLTASCPSKFIMLDKIEVFNSPLDDFYINEEIALDSTYQNPGQIMSVDDASYFSFSKSIKPIATGFSYDSNKSISTAQTYNLTQTYENYLNLTSGTEGYFTDSVFLPTADSNSHNQISWQGDSGGISFSYNTDGGSTYTPVSNNSSIPNFFGGTLYYKVTISRSSDSVKSPQFTGLYFYIYDSKDFLSDNTLYSLNTNFNYSVGGDRSSLIDQSYSNGIETASGGFSLNVDEARSVEFMFTPSSLSQTCLVDCGTARYSWSEAGAITKSNISSIYVNGVDLYSQTSISNVFIPGVMHHVVLTFSSSQANQVFINQSKTGTLIGPNNRFAHLGIYDYDMSAKAINHYKYMSSKAFEAAGSEDISLGEDSCSGFNVDKVVLSTQ